MQTMSTAMATLLKSGKMIGNNRPTSEVIIGGGGVSDFEFGDTWVKPSTTYTFNSLSVAEKANGKLIVCNVHNNVVMEGEAVDKDTLLAGDDGAVNWVSTGITAAAYGWAAVFNIDNELYLNFSDMGVDGVSPARKLIYKSPSGNGEDWVLYSTIQNWAWSGLNANNDGYKIFTELVGIPIKLDNGDWVMNNGYFFDYSGYLCHRIYFTKSTDGGVTWTNGDYMRQGYVANVYYASFNKKIVKMDNGDLYSMCSGALGSLPLRFYKSTDNGTTWTMVKEYDSYTKWPDNVFWSFELFEISNQLYCVAFEGGTSANGDTEVIKFNDLADLEDAEIVKNLTGTPALSSVDDNTFLGFFDGELIIGIEEYLLGIDPIKGTLQPKSITISRAKGMAGGLTVEFDNKSAILAPDGTANPQLLWPNKEVVVKQGYGAELLKTFTGLIDNISMSRDEQGVASVTVSARDKLKVALDHLIRNAEFLYTLTYTNMLVEDIWKNLVGLAGLTYNTVEATGLTISEKTFSWETYADAFSWLDEIAGFETYCDEDGKLNFVWDGRPATVTTAYQFVEGVDITRLGYEINDVDLYYTVAVYGKSPEVLDENDEVVTESSVIYFARQLPQATYWGIPSGKVLRIDAPDADTQAKCEIIADKAIYLMQTRARQVTFSTIGIPHLQRGDFIQVTESSTTISEIYRITDITTQQGPDGYGMTLTCYYHAAPEVV